MSKLKEVLWNTLEKLNDQQLKHFQWFLKQDDVVEGSSAIPVAQLERADRQDTVDLMVQTHGDNKSLEMTKMILEKICRNDLVQHLAKFSSGLRDAALLRREYETKKSALVETKIETTTMIQERRMKIHEIQQVAELSRKSADRQMDNSQQVFTELLQSVQTILAHLLRETEETQRTAQKQAEQFVQELEKDISDLTSRSTELEQLTCIEDPWEFLQRYLSLNAAPATKDWTGVDIAPPLYGQSVARAAHRLKEELGKKTETLIAKARLNRVRQFAANVTLDPDTANPYLVVSDDGKRVYCGDVKLHLPDRPERFDPAVNVLGRQSLSSGRLYYEVQVEGSSSWDLGVVRDSVSRKGSVHAKPENGYWTVCLRPGGKYRASAMRLRVERPPRKVGVFVDHGGGSVSFYDADSADLLHSFEGCSFDGKLRPFFSPGLRRGESHAPLIIS